MFSFVLIEFSVSFLFLHDKTNVTVMAVINIVLISIFL
ncbi:hypothetical protein FORMA_16930 [Formosa sp. Hel3_A1_48]|nr:hypothetical protein FORMA_16930 [Formosa sp. Hel3_A1_48]